MSRLRERIDRLLRLRRHELDQTRRDLDRECEICESFSRAQVSAESRARGVDGQVRRALEKGASGADSRALHGVSSAAREAAQAAAGRHEDAREQVASRRERVVLAWQRMKGLELLRARRDRADALVSARRRERELDDLGRRVWRERGQ